MKDKEYSVKNVFHIISRTIRFDFKMWLYSTFGAFITAVPWFITIFLNGLLMKKAVSAAAEGRQIWGVVAFIIGILIFLRLPNIVGYGINSWSSEHISGKMQEKMIQKWLKQDEKTASKNHTGDIMARITNDCAVELSDFYFQGFGLLVVEPLVTGIAALITVYIIDKRLVIFSLIMGICSTLISSLFSKSIQEEQTKAQEGHAQVSKSVSNILYGIVTIKLFQLKDNELNTLREQCDLTKEFNMKVCNKKQLVTFCGNMFEILTIGGCLLLGAIYSSKGELYFPDVMIVLQMQVLINALVSSIGTAWNYLVEVSVYSKRVFEVLDYKEEEERTNKGDILKKDKDVLLECSNLCFQYDKDLPVLKDINLKIKPGQKVAIIGESGCGKSTLFKILLGLYPTFTGELKIMGTNFFDCNLKSWRKQISIVQQEKALFDKTIAENIALGCSDNNRNSSREEIEEAAKMAGAHEFIKSLPNGYDTLVGEMGNTLSGGQQQRIAIARAFLKDSPLLLLDEVTSALDAESERLVQKSLENLMRNRTVLMITHKFSIIKNADLIIAFKDGKIIEYGSHDELISKDGYYSKMCKLQAINK